MEKPITTRFKLPRVEMMLVPTYIPDGIQKLLAACEEGDTINPPLHRALVACNKAIVTLFVDTGIRLSELADLPFR